MQVARLVAVTSLITLLFLAQAEVVDAFDSYHPTAESTHEKITEEALKDQGFSSDAIEYIEDFNTYQDWSEWQDKSKYRPEHHFDRPPGKSHADAFKDGARYVRAEMDKAKECLKKCDTMGAIAAIGRALHTVQDFFAHSNYVDLSDADKAAAKDALFDPTKDPPSNLKLTGYDPNAEDPYNPPGDPYPHGRGKEANAKDSADHPQHGEAKKAAVEASREMVKKIKTELEKELGADKAKELWKKFANFKGKRFIILLPPPYEEYSPAEIKRIEGLGCILGSWELAGLDLKDSKNLIEQINLIARGFSPEYPYGLNAEVAAFRITALTADVRDAVARGDIQAAQDITRTALDYSKRIIDEARSMNVDVDQALVALWEAQNLYETGHFEGALLTIPAITNDLLPKAYPAFQKPLEFSIYLIKATHVETEKPLKNMAVALQWPYYEANVKVGEEGYAVLIGPPGKFEYIVPLELNLLGLPLLEYFPQLKNYFVWTRGLGTAPEGSLTMLDISISTLFIPAEMAILIANNAINILLFLLILLPIAWKLAKRLRSRGIWSLKSKKIAPSYEMGIKKFFEVIGSRNENMFHSFSVSKGASPVYASERRPSITPQR